MKVCLPIIRKHEHLTPSNIKLYFSFNLKTKKSVLSLILGWFSCIKRIYHRLHHTRLNKFLKASRRVTNPRSIPKHRSQSNYSQATSLIHPFPQTNAGGNTINLHDSRALQPCRPPIHPRRRGCTPPETTGRPVTRSARDRYARLGFDNIRRGPKIGRQRASRAIRLCTRSRSRQAFSTPRYTLYAMLGRYTARSRVFIGSDLRVLLPFLFGCRSSELCVALLHCGEKGSVVGCYWVIFEVTKILGMIREMVRKERRDIFVG